MSLKKQVKRNIQKQNEDLLKRYEPFLKPNWQSRPKEDINLLASMAKNGITYEDMQREIKRARMTAFEDTALAVLKVGYAVMAITLHEDFGMSKDECFNVLTAIDKRLAVTIDNEEVIEEMREKVGIRFNSDNGVERIEKV